MIGLALTILPAFDRWESLLAVMSVYGLGFGLLFPAMTALLADETEPRTRGAASGVFTAVYSLAVVAGTSATGFLDWLYRVSGIHPFQSATLLILVVLVWVWLAWRNNGGDVQPWSNA